MEMSTGMSLPAIIWLVVMFLTAKPLGRFSRRFDWSDVKAVNMLALYAIVLAILLVWLVPSILFFDYKF